MSAVRGTETPGVDLGAEIAAAMQAMRQDPDPRWRAASRWMLTAGADLWAHGPLHCADGCHDCDDELWMPHVRAAVELARTYLTYAHRRGELIPASAVLEVADEWVHMAQVLREDAACGDVEARRLAENLQRRIDDLRALVESARAGDAQ